MFKVANTFNAASPVGSQQGFPAPGSGAQTVGAYTPPPGPVEWTPQQDTKGFRSWFKPAQSQSGFPSPQDAGQRRPRGSMPNVPKTGGLALQVETPYFSRGAAAFVQNFGKVLTNPIGNGIQALYRPQASYGGAAQYENGALWWTSQAIPTSIHPQGLTTPDELAAILSGVQVQAVVRTTG